MTYMYTTIEAAQADLRAAEEDVIADMGEEALDGGGTVDLIRGMLHLCSPSVAKELQRRELGYPL